MSIDLTNLEAQVQARIDGLTGTETLKDLLILSKAAEGLDVDRTDLDAALQTFITAFDGTTDEKDLLVANKSLAAPFEGGSEFGLSPAPTANYNSAFGGLWGQLVTGLSITSKTEVLSLSGKFLVFNIGYAAAGTSGNMFISLNIDGEDICVDLDTGSTAAAGPIYSADSGQGGIANGLMHPLVVNESLSLSLQKSSGSGAWLRLLIIPIN